MRRVLEQLVFAAAVVTAYAAIEIVGTFALWQMQRTRKDTE